MNADENRDGKDEYNSSLQEEIERLKRDNRAMQEEFNNLAETDDGTLTPEAVRKALVAGAPVAIQEILILSHNADSESVRLAASKYIIDYASGKTGVGENADSSFQKFLETLKKPQKDKPDKKVTEKSVIKELLDNARTPEEPPDNSNEGML